MPDGAPLQTASSGDDATVLVDIAARLPDIRDWVGENVERLVRDWDGAGEADEPRDDQDRRSCLPEAVDQVEGAADHEEDSCDRVGDGADHERCFDGDTAGLAVETEASLFEFGLEERGKVQEGLVREQPRAEGEDEHDGGEGDLAAA